MRRRRYVAVLGALFASGCTSLQADFGGDDEPSGTDPSGTEPVERITVAETVAVGTPSGVEDSEGDPPHAIAVRNEAATTREVEVVVESTDGEGRSLLNTTDEVPARASVRVEIHAPDEYRVTVRVSSAGARKSFRVRRLVFDCNDSATVVAVSRDGSLSITRRSEMLACGEESSSARTTRPATEPS